MAPAARPLSALHYVNIRCRTGRHERSGVTFIDDMVAVLRCPECDTEWAVPASLPEIRRLTSTIAVSGERLSH
jgi:hypothetical protein